MGSLRYWGDGGVEVEVGVCNLKMAEDTGECTPEQAAAPLLDKLTSSLRVVLQTHHHISEESDMTGIVGHVRMWGVRLTDISQGRVGPIPEALEHRGMHALQRPPLKHFFPVLPRDGLGVGGPLPKREQLGAGGGQVRLRRDQGGSRGLLTPLRLI